MTTTHYYESAWEHELQRLLDVLDKIKWFGAITTNVVETKPMTRDDWQRALEYYRKRYM